MAEAIEEIASPRDTYGFASGGVYCFWRVDSRQVLYIGRAVDLPERFAQHNGLRGTALGSKRELIGKHFEEEDVLGFSALVRSPASQTPVARHLHRVEADFGAAKESDWEDLTKPPKTENEREIAAAEGTAIRSYQLAYDALPPWNRISGEVSAWGAAMRRPDSTGDLMTGAVDSLLQARRSFRELASDPTATQFETVLHLARSYTAVASILANKQLSDWQILEALDQLEDHDSVITRERIRESRYVVGPSSLSVDPSIPQAELRAAWSDGRSLPQWPSPPPLR